MKQTQNKFICWCLLVLWISLIVNAWGIFGLFGTIVRVFSSLSCGVIGLIYLARAPTFNLRNLLLILVYFFSIILTIPFSMAPLYGTVSYMAGFGIIIFLIAISQTHRGDYWEIISKYSYPVIVIALVFSLCHVLLSHGWEDNRFRSILGGANSVGAVASILFGITVIRLLKGKGRRKKKLIICILITFASLSLFPCKTAIIGLCVSLVTLYMLQKVNKFGLKATLFFTLLTIILSLLIFDLKYDIEKTFKSILSDERSVNQTFTGRGIIWRHAFIAIREKPFWGYGAGSSGVALGLMANKNETSHYLAGDVRSDVHNSYLLLLLDCGILGFFPFMAIIAVSCYSVSKSIAKGDIETCEQFLIIAVGLLCALNSNNFLQISSPWTLLTWSAIIGVLFKSEKRV